MRPDNQSSASSLSAGLPAGQHLPMAVLRQYVAGTLPAAEQHRVEAHTLACPRCADVLEGLSQTDLPTTDQALADLQTRLRARVAQETPEATPVVALWPMRQLAAAVLVLLAAAALWLGVRRTTEGPASAPRVAMQQPARPSGAVPPPPAPAATSAEAEAAPPTDGAYASATVSAAEQAAVRRPSAKPSVALRSARRQPVVLADKDNEMADIAAAAAPSGTTLGDGVGSKELVVADSGSVAQTVNDVADKDKPEAYRARAAKKKAAPVVASSQVPVAGTRALAGSITSAAVPAGMRLVRGQVTDQTDGTRLPGVTVLAKGTTLGVSTAADGSFALLVPDSVKALTFNSVGYATSVQPLGITDSTLALALAPDTKQLSEVAVVRRERPPAPMSIGALPAGGYSAFREYLKKNLEYPEKALKDGREGTVKLRFVVAVDGSLQDIKVLSGLSEECDAEAIRLLKEGPRWYPAISKGRRTARTVEISVPFRVTE